MKSTLLGLGLGLGLGLKLGLGLGLGLRLGLVMLHEAHLVAQDATDASEPPDELRALL